MMWVYQNPMCFSTRGSQPNQHVAHAHIAYTQAPDNGTRRSYQDFSSLNATPNRNSRLTVCHSPANIAIGRTRLIIWISMAMFYG
jgi:hypothetical protein